MAEVKFDEIGYWSEVKLDIIREYAAAYSRILSKHIDLFLNFPIMDANRNALWRDPERVQPKQAKRLTAYWGDESWRSAAYRPTRQMALFGGKPEKLEKAENQAVAEAFRKRLQDVAGFANVPSPMPMRNKQRKHRTKRA